MRRCASRRRLGLRLRWPGCWCARHRDRLGAVRQHHFAAEFQRSDPGAKSDGIPAEVLTPPTQLQSLGGLNGLFEQMRQKFGDTMGYQPARSIPTTPSSTAPTPSEPRRKLSYAYRGGWGDAVRRRRPRATATCSSTSASSTSSRDRRRSCAGAPETLGIKPKDVKTTAPT